MAKGYSFPEAGGSGLRELVPEASVEMLELMKECLRWDPQKRPSAKLILAHLAFYEVEKVLPSEVLQEY